MPPKPPQVLKHTIFLSVITIMCKAQLRWAGHVSCMPDNCIPKQLLYRGEAHSWRAKKTFQGQPEGLPLTDPAGAISSSKEPMQQRSTGPFKLSRNVQHARPEPPAPTHFYPNCGRGFLARIDPISHLRTHHSSSSAN